MGTTLWAQEDEGPAFSVSGSVDTYYRVNINAANDPDGKGYEVPATSFANGSGFSLGMANLVASVEGEKTGMVADFVFGPRGNEAVFGSVFGSNPIVNQLYAYWNVNESLTLTLGNFNTFLGYEVISPTGNFNYSTSYMFSYGPFSHTGAKADIALGDLSFMVGVFNTTDATETSPDGQYFGGFQVGYKGTYVNLLFDDDFFQADLTAGWDLTDAFYLGVNATTASDNFYGGALYLQNSFSESFALGLRGEYFSDEGVGALTVAENVIDVTLSSNIKVGELTLIPEFRVDIYSDDEITPEVGETPQSSLASFLLAAVYAF